MPALFAEGRRIERVYSRSQVDIVMYTVSRKRKAEVQVGCPFAERSDIGVQCSESKGATEETMTPNFDIRSTQGKVPMGQGFHS